MSRLDTKEKRIYYNRETMTSKKDAGLKTVLLIEDDLFIREVYEHHLENAGFGVIGAGDGAEGLKLAMEKHPDIILLDIMLPKIHGIEVLRKLKADVDTKSIPVVMLTNLAQENVVEETIKIGAAGYLIKMRIAPHEIVDYIRDFFQQK